MNFAAFPVVIAGIAGYFPTRPGNDRKAEFRPDNSGSEQREEFVYQESS
jgi:hypothetical protein